MGGHSTPVERVNPTRVQFIYSHHFMDKSCDGIDLSHIQKNSKIFLCTHLKQIKIPEGFRFLENPIESLVIVCNWIGKTVVSFCT